MLVGSRRVKVDVIRREWWCWWKWQWWWSYWQDGSVSGICLRKQKYKKKETKILFTCVWSVSVLDHSREQSASRKLQSASLCFWMHNCKEKLAPQ
jgi:hypothetical protein